MTTVSLNFRQSAYAQETGRVLICLMTLTHDDLEEPIRLSSDPTERLDETVSEVVYGTVSRSQEYVYLPMTLKLPDDTDSGPGEMVIELDNIHRAYTQAIRTIQSPVKVNVELVMDNDLDTVEGQWPEYLLTGVTYDSAVIRGTLRMETLESEPFPSGTFNPSYFPGLF